MPILCALFDHRYRWLDVDPALIAGGWSRVAYLACTRCLNQKLGPDGRTVRLVER